MPATRPKRAPRRTPQPPVTGLYIRLDSSAREFDELLADFERRLNDLEARMFARIETGLKKKKLARARTNGARKVGAPPT